MKLSHRIALSWRILRYRPSNLMAHANRELPKSDEPMQTRMNQNLRELILVFGTQGHSGFSAALARDALHDLLAYKPLSPLTGEPHEWVDVSECVGVECWQNKRASHVFKQADRFDGQAYDINGKVFCEPNGSRHTSAESRVPIVFPYTPTTEYVDVPASAPDPVPAPTSAWAQTFVHVPGADEERRA